VIVPDTVAPEAGEVIDTVGGVAPVLLTVTETAALVVLLFEVSVATAVRECFPLLKVVVFSDAEYGAVVSAPPISDPSTSNCTLAIPTLDEALAVTVMVPDTLAPEAGDVIDTVGGFPVELFTVIETAGLVALFFAASVATAVRECLPADRVLVLSELE